MKSNKEYQRAYRLRNKEKIRAYHRDYYSKNKKLCRSYQKKHYLKNREKEIARCSAWNKKNPRKVADSMQRCRDRRPEYYYQYQKKYVKEHHEMYRISWRNKDHKRRSITKLGHVSALDWKLILKSTNGCCFYCGIGNINMTMDHYIPLSKGGQHYPKNIVPACHKCNSRKNNMMPDLFMKKIGRA